MYYCKYLMICLKAYQKITFLIWCLLQLDEIELCPNCYYMSNAKPEGWFCQPCVSCDNIYCKTVCKNRCEICKTINNSERNVKWTNCYYMSNAKPKGSTKHTWVVIILLVVLCMTIDVCKTLITVKEKVKWTNTQNKMEIIF